VETLEIEVRDSSDGRWDGDKVSRPSYTDARNIAKEIAFEMARDYDFLVDPTGDYDYPYYTVTIKEENGNIWRKIVVTGEE